MVCGVAPQMEQNSPSCQVRHMKGVPCGQGRASIINDQTQQPITGLMLMRSL